MIQVSAGNNALSQQHSYSLIQQKDYHDETAWEWN
jgi:hypothetical protein